MGKSLQFSLNCLTRFSPKSHKLNPNPYTREAIAYFATSLDFNLGLSQAESQVYDGTFREMCRSVYEHPMRAEVRWADGDLGTVSFITHMELAQVLDSRLSTTR